MVTLAKPMETLAQPSALLDECSCAFGVSKKVTALCLLVGKKSQHPRASGPIQAAPVYNVATAVRLAPTGGGSSHVTGDSAAARVPLETEAGNAYAQQRRTVQYVPIAVRVLGAARRVRSPPPRRRRVATRHATGPPTTVLPRAPPVHWRGHVQLADLAPLPANAVPCVVCTLARFATERKVAQHRRQRSPRDRKIPYE